MPPVCKTHTKLPNFVQIIGTRKVWELWVFHVLSGRWCVSLLKTLAIQVWSALLRVFDCISQIVNEAGHLRMSSLAILMPSAGKHSISKPFACFCWLTCFLITYLEDILCMCIHKTNIFSQSVLSFHVLNNAFSWADFTNFTEALSITVSCSGFVCVCVCVSFLSKFHLLFLKDLC